jgi:hypothetical protein
MADKNLERIVGMLRHDINNYIALKTSNHSKNVLERHKNSIGDSIGQLIDARLAEGAKQPPDVDLRPLDDADPAMYNLIFNLMLVVDDRIRQYEGSRADAAGS